LEVTAACKTASCDVTCTDCIWGKWSDWGDCSKCGGQRVRHRNIVQLPNHCGKLCDLKATKEVSNCTSHCVEDAYCVWTDWSSTSGCSAGCGPSSGMRNRALGLAKKASNYLFIGKPSSQCSGSQLLLNECKEAPSCKPACVPRKCTFGMWSEWAAPTCIGLCERERVIETINNECGDPCMGPLLETKKCDPECNKPVDCIMSAWSEWSEGDCSREGGQKIRQRVIQTMPENSGKPCEVPLSETSQCTGKTPVVPCEVAAWTAWTQCTLTCGGGLQTRSRAITQVSVGGGPGCEDSLEEMQPCNTQPCKPKEVVDLSL